MQTFLHSSSFVSLLNSWPPLQTHSFLLNHCGIIHSPKSSTFHSFPATGSLKITSISQHFQPWKTTDVSFFSQNDAFDGFSSSQLPGKPQNDRNRDNEELELLSKPSPVAIDVEKEEETDKQTEQPDEDDALAPFLKFFKSKDPLEEAEVELENEETNLGVTVEKKDLGGGSKEAQKVNVDYYEPKPGDFVVGVVVSGNENKLDVNIGADLLGTLLTKEVLPLYGKDTNYMLFDMEKDTEKLMVKGKMGIIKDEAAMSGGPVSGRPVVDTGTVLFAEVLGRTLSGRPLISARRLFRRIAWHRVRQVLFSPSSFAYFEAGWIKELNQPIEVNITEWNTGGLLTRIEGLRAFLPKAELMNKVKNFKELKENVGRQIHVLVTRINEANNDLILSERRAWEMVNLQEGTLLEGTVQKIFPYGAQVRIGETNRSGLLHVSNITRTSITSVSDILQVDEHVKVLVVKSMFPGKISLSIADLESEPGLFISNREKVLADAEVMAKRYRQNLPASLTTPNAGTGTGNGLFFHDEESFYANWKWFKFERD
ncbi:hypothetical protein K2173_011186 [Erythroxylum novogranatense]|uniref:S1 motif domain-containing protein n=1 Tax=Erythroxylum novogranatense TaxID=1862640 RepID=A0AAV8TVL5_9ROSI|nr:hypothetical protein K2173_011186 [Erythroxylum novogranatense]